MFSLARCQAATSNRSNPSSLARLFGPNVLKIRLLSCASRRSAFLSPRKLRIRRGPREPKSRAMGAAKNFNPPRTTMSSARMVAQSARLSPSGSQFPRSPMASAFMQIVYIVSCCILPRSICPDWSAIAQLVSRVSAWSRFSTRMVELLFRRLRTSAGQYGRGAAPLDSAATRIPR